MLKNFDNQRFSPERTARAGNAVELIADELAFQRGRGHTAESDINFANGELVDIAECFLVGFPFNAMNKWPENWSVSLIKDKSRVRQLVIAGALIAAEIQRLQTDALTKLNDGASSMPNIEI